MDFEALEATTGVRFTWQYWLASKQAQSKLAVPPAVLVTFTKDVPDMPVLNYNPTQCRHCKGVLSFHAVIELASKTWACPFCSTSQPLPQQYHGISPADLPAELYPDMSVVEYQLPGPPHAPVCLFILDLCMSAEDQECMKLSVEQALQFLPDNTLVGIITFGAMVYVHEMQPSDIPRCVMFRGTQETTRSALAQSLSLGFARAGASSAGPSSVYLIPLAECSFAIDCVLESLTPEEPLPGQRARRCTGAALSVATTLLETCATHSGGRAMLFTSGPCTVGPGMIVEPGLADAIRTHKDLAKGSAKWFRKAVDFYDKLAERLVDNGQCLDIFACALDQTGLAEMQHMVACTGGVMVMAETFEHDVYRRSLASLLRCDAAGCLATGLNGTLEVQASKHIAVRGAIGPIASLEKRADHTPVAEPMIGLGRTTSWKVNAFNSADTVAVFFEVTAPPGAVQPGQSLTLQFRTMYQHASGYRRLRVCTVSRYWQATTAAPTALGFDQHAAAVVMSRWAAFMAETEDATDMGRWVDQQLVAICSRYCEFDKGRVETLRMSPDFEMYPEYIFHLRRSMFLDIFNNTPDETAFYRLMLFREPCGSCVLMLRPKLWRYSLESPTTPLPCQLDVSAIDPSGVMLLDSWFCVVVHTGAHLAAWRTQGYFASPDYSHIKEMVDQAHNDARALVDSRNPLPRLVVCDQNGSQARFLLVRLNPSRTHENAEAAAQVLGPDQVVYTDDVSFSVFVEQLKKLAVMNGSS